MNKAELASQFLSVIPMAMRQIRKQMRTIAPSELSVPQFRILIQLYKKTTSTNNELAEHIGTTEPSMSRMVNSLLRRGWVIQERSTRDRRTVILKLSTDGRKKFSAITSDAQSFFEEEFSKLPEEKRKIMHSGLKILAEALEDAT